MKSRMWFVLSVAFLVVTLSACGGGDTPPEPQPTPIPPEPTGVPEPEPVDEPVDAGLDYTLDPNFGTEDISAGFVPDPYEVEVLSGGEIWVTELNLGDGCRGHATSAPDFRFYWSGSTADLRVFFVPDDPGDDATLVINTASAEWACNDDYNGYNPLVELDSPAEGQYDVWVGSFMSGEYIAGTLYITELELEPNDYTD